MSIVISHPVWAQGTQGDPPYTVYIHGKSILLTRNDLATLGRMIDTALTSSTDIPRVTLDEERGIYAPGF